MIKETYIVTNKEVKYLEDGKVVWVEPFKNKADREATIKHLQTFGDTKFEIEETLKGSASMQFNSVINEDNWGEVEDRYISIDVTFTSESEEAVEKIADKFIEKFEEEADVEFARCPDIIKLKNGKYQYTDMFTVDYDYGYMAEIRKDLKTAFKAVKKEMGIR